MNGNHPVSINKALVKQMVTSIQHAYYSGVKKEKKKLLMN